MTNQKYKVVLKISNVEELLRIQNIQTLIVFCHIYNNVSTSHRLLLSLHRQPISFLSDRDNMYMINVSSSYLYEGIKKAYRLLRNNYSLIPTDSHSEYAWMRGEIFNHDSFYNKILSNIRNKLGFHFSGDVFSNTYISRLESFPITIGSGIKDNSINFAFEYTDTIMMYYLSSLVNSDRSDEDNIIYIVENLRDYNIRYIDFIRAIINSIAGNYTELEVQYCTS
jgi:hypothetical protein